MPVRTHAHINHTPKDEVGRMNQVVHCSPLLCEGADRKWSGASPEATMHAMATEILRYRHCVRQLADAIGWTSAGAPFGLIRPGPYWGPRRGSDGTLDVAPPAA